jgi:hypothetical protein
LKTQLLWKYKQFYHDWLISYATEKERLILLNCHLDIYRRYIPYVFSSTLIYLVFSFYKVVNFLENSRSSSLFSKHAGFDHIILLSHIEGYTMLFKYSFKKRSKDSKSGNRRAAIGPLYLVHLWSNTALMCSLYCL